MLGSHVKAAVAIAAAVVLCVAAILTVYGRLHLAATVSSSPSSLLARESVLPSPAPLSTMVPQPWVPDWESVSGGAAQLWTDIPFRLRAAPCRLPCRVWYSSRL